jgi:hypothetical protein
MSVISGPAVGVDFFDREEEVETILRSLRNDNILLVAPRRYGKTSVMRAVEKKLTERGYVCLYLDVMHIPSPKEFVFWLAIAAFDARKERGTFLDHLKSCFARLGERLQEVEVSTSGVKATFTNSMKEEISDDNWSSKGYDIFNAIKHLSEKSCICIIVDELSECVNNIRRRDEETAREFLQWLRSVRQTKFEDLKFVVGGSVSFRGIVRNFGSLAWINDLKTVDIRGFQEDVALSFIKKTFEDSGWDYEDEIGRKILECIGEPYIPYFISIFLSMIFDDERWLSEEDIEELYMSKLLGAHGRGYFDYYKQRLGIYYDEALARAADDILREVCLAEQGYPKALAFDLFQKATGIQDDEKFVNLLYDLENDFYITVDGEHIRFQSKVLRDWWRLYNV